MPSIVYNEQEVRHTPAVHPTSPGNKHTHTHTHTTEESKGSQRKQEAAEKKRDRSSCLIQYYV